MSTTTSIQDAPFSIIDGLCGQGWGAAILSAVSLENPTLPSDFLTAASKHVAVACLDPGGICLTMIV